MLYSITAICMQYHLNALMKIYQVHLDNSYTTLQHNYIELLAIYIATSSITS